MIKLLRNSKKILAIATFFVLLITVLVFSSCNKKTSKKEEKEQTVKKQSKYSYPVVDTSQKNSFNNTSQINSPSEGQPFYGQDDQHKGAQPKYKDNGDETSNRFKHRLDVAEKSRRKNDA